MKSEGHPEPGSVSVCLYCQVVLIFQEDMTLRFPTAEEEQEMRSDSEAWNLLQKCRWIIKEIR